MNAPILLVEDDENIALGITEIFKGEGFEVVHCSRGDQVLSMALKTPPRLIILDVMLPGLSGFDACKQLRTKGITAPILMLTAKGQEIDKVVGLELGADDYVTKPFGVRELIARVNALLRRAEVNRPREPKRAARFKIGTAEVDPATFEVRRNKSVEKLTSKEVKLLQIFHDRAGEVLSREQLLVEVWGEHYYGTNRSLDQVIVQLRKKIGDASDDAKHLQTVHGVGYKMVL
jgi:DNA-binding response OmpR family regulator